jgi:hypothetical protein
MRHPSRAAFLFTLLCSAAALATAGPKAKPASSKISKEGQACIACHEATSAGLVKEWRLSRHAKTGVDCYTCHKAAKTDPDAMEHNGFTIAVLVTPKDCGQCHTKEVAEESQSHHAKAGDILNSLDNYMGEVVGGHEVVVTGCLQCHGGKVKVLANGKLDPESWPNTGIGRINPDGSKGSCAACHARHSFSKAQARQPETCGKCHLGPDHPQKEIYEESKHGILYAAHKSELNMQKDKWVVGQDYSAAPTCATCHMSATPSQPVTHDVGARISWTLRPPVSKKQEHADQKRAAMKDVCSNCHSEPFIENHYKQFDNLVDLYDSKFAKPATAIRAELIQRGKLNGDDLGQKINWTYFEIWHHEGRRARMAAAMSGPDYAWWHGIYDVSQKFYADYLPEVKHLAGPELYNELIQKYLAPDVRHEWFLKGMSKDQLDRIKKYYDERYGDKTKAQR